MEGHVLPYLKEVGLVGNIPGQLQGTYVAAYLHGVHTRLKSMPCVECNQITSLFRCTTSLFTLHEQLRCHQFLMHSLTRHEYFAIRVVRVQ